MTANITMIAATARVGRLAICLPTVIFILSILKDCHVGDEPLSDATRDAPFLQDDYC
jgi:hypothetical protein